MSLHAITPEKPMLRLSDRTKLGIANFLAYHNRQYPIFYVLNTKQLYYVIGTNEYLFPFVEDYCSSVYGNHEFQWDDVRIVLTHSDMLDLIGARRFV